MPLIASAQTLPVSAALAERLARLQPACVVTSASPEATLYIGWFNTKPIAAAWVNGIAGARVLSGFAIHPATLGRGVLAQLATQIRDIESADGHRVLSSDDYTVLDPG